MLCENHSPRKHRRNWEKFISFQKDFDNLNWRFNAFMANKIASQYVKKGQPQSRLMSI